jgi:eukaryotic-like serine/threonine-protein kinase
MRPLPLLKCLAKALVHHGAKAVGLGAAWDIMVGVGEDVWKEWNRQSDEDQRRAEIASIVRMAGQEFRQQVEEIVHEVASDRTTEVQTELSRQLSELPNLLRLALRRPADLTGTSVPPELSLKRAEDLMSLLSSSQPRRPAQVPDPKAGTLASRVILSITGGTLQGKQLSFEERTSLLVGRHQECQLRFAADSENRTISRHHCLVDINPPDVCVRDLGSRGGTFVNAELIGQRPKEMDRKLGRKLIFAERPLKDGDEVKLCKRGTATFSVAVVVPARDSDTAQRCVQCGRDVAGEMGSRRQGEFLCATCRGDPDQLVQRLQAATGSDGRTLPPVQGYIPLRELGRGGMGVVWLARHERTQREVALKVMLPKVAAEPRAVKRFLHEMSNHGVLRHRHVVAVDDIGYANGTFYMTLEYCAGGSVAGLIKQRGGKLPLNEAVEIALQALIGLDYAHNALGPGKGFVHRDVKPANLFLTGNAKDRVVKVGDFGLAKAFDDAGLSGSTRTGDTAGTPHYMPRQQVIDFKYARPDVDVWALAATLYKMLTGFVPRDSREDLDPWLVVLEDPPVPIRQRDAGIPIKLATLLDDALRDTDALLFSSASQFQKALQAAL